MTLKPENVEQVVLACCVLHNLLRIWNPSHTEGFDYEDPETHEVHPGCWRMDPPMESRPMTYLNLGRYNDKAKAQRAYIKSYCSSPAGSVPWQDSMI